MNANLNEIEIKLALPDAATGRKLLRSAGFHVAVRRSFESNALFDTRDQELRRQGMALRLRIIRSTAVLTFKGPSESGIYKSRLEREVVVSNAAEAAAILCGLGYSPQFRYEKYRTEYRRSDISAVVLLDETPIGVFLEIEGNPRSINRAAALLGFRKEDYLTTSYTSLYRQYCESRNLQPTGMLFVRGAGSARANPGRRKKIP